MRLLFHIICFSLFLSLPLTFVSVFLSFSLSSSLLCFKSSTFFPFLAKSYSSFYPHVFSAFILPFPFFRILYSQFLSHSLFFFHSLIHARSPYVILFIFCEKRSSSRNINGEFFTSRLWEYSLNIRGGGGVKDCGKSETESRLIKNYPFKACPVISDKWYHVLSSSFDPPVVVTAWYVISLFFSCIIFLLLLYITIINIVTYRLIR